MAKVTGTITKAYGVESILNKSRTVYAEKMVAKGPKGDPGEKGDKGDPGEKGEPGEPGKDYEITEADYQAIASMIPDIDLAELDRKLKEVLG